MMRLFLTTVVVLLTAVAANSMFEFAEEWNQWKLKHGKRYLSDQEEIERQKVWLANKKYIDEHNAEADSSSFTLAMNQFGDMSDSEYHKVYTSYRNHKTTSEKKVYMPPAQSNFPDTVDWRSNGAVTPVKNQGYCGSCYAFSAVGALEGANALAHNELVPLSEQNVVDCSVPYGNHGCKGGDIHTAFQYIINNGGIDTEKSYPYKGKQGQCHYNTSQSAASMSGIVSILSGKEDDLLAAVATVGPISAAVDASSNAFRFYAGGVFDTVHCSSTKVSHGVLIVGYGEYSGKKYWLVKNSWGVDWGLNGYIMMARDRYNQCGIATDASYPTL